MLERRRITLATLGAPPTVIFSGAGILKLTLLRLYLSPHHGSCEMLQSSPVRYRPEVESRQDDEADTVGELNATFDTILQKTSEDYHHAVRAVHAKSHG